MLQKQNALPNTSPWSKWFKQDSNLKNRPNVSPTAMHWQDCGGHALDNEVARAPIGQKRKQSRPVGSKSKQHQRQFQLKMSSTHNHTYAAKAPLERNVLPRRTASTEASPSADHKVDLRDVPLFIRPSVAPQMIPRQHTGTTSVDTKALQHKAKQPHHAQIVSNKLSTRHTGADHTSPPTSTLSTQTMANLGKEASLMLANILQHILQHMQAATYKPHTPWQTLATCS